MKSKTMEALVWTAPRVMELRQEPIPQQGEGEALIEVLAAGICGSDLGGYLGHNSLRKPPLIMGHEAVGRILKGAKGLLSDGTAAREGQRVTFNPLISCGICDRCAAGLPNLCRTRKLVGAHRPGAFAQYVAAPLSLCWPVPDSIADAPASAAEPIACGLRAVDLAQGSILPLRGGRTKVGVAAEVSLATRYPLLDTLFVLGAGPIGLAALAGAIEAGIPRIFVSDMAPSRLEIAKEWGATEILNAGDQDVVSTVKDLTGGRGADAVIDAVGSTGTRDQALKAVVPGGRVVFIGLHEEHSKIEANYIVRQELSVTGCFAYTQSDFKRALDLLVRSSLPLGGGRAREGVVKPKEGDGVAGKNSLPLGGGRARERGGFRFPSWSWLEERPLSQGPQAFADLVDGRAMAPKIVLKVT